MSSSMELTAVENFREYIRTNTMHPDPNYEDAKNFLIKMANQLQLQYKVLEFVPKNPIVLMTWQGTDNTLPSILLNSHVDVVPCFPESWKYDPFAAVMTENGDIFGRGTQDMKCVGMQYLEAIRVLKSQNFTPLRTIHLSFVPDEEVGGNKGMALLIESPEFKSLNVGFALDEGLASPTDEYVIYYGERTMLAVNLDLNGNPGHGSLFIENTASNKLVIYVHSSTYNIITLYRIKFLNKYQQYRDSEEERLKSNPKFHVGDVTTGNLTILEGGVQRNVVPSNFKAVIDFRVTPTFPAKDFRAMIYKWAAEVGIPESEVSIPTYSEHAPITSIDDSDPWWSAFKSTCDTLKMKIRCEIFPAATDSRYVRKAKIPAIGFSPMINTPILLHDHNEYLNRNVFLQGVKIYADLLRAISRVAKF